jgi:hypothetical protein
MFTSTLSLVYAVTVQLANLATVLKETKAVLDLELAIELLDSLSIQFAAATKIRRMAKKTVQRGKELSYTG